MNLIHWLCQNNHNKHMSLQQFFQYVNFQTEELCYRLYMQVEIYKKFQHQVRRGKIIAPKIKAIAEQLSDHLDTRVNVELGKKKGKIVIEFATIEDLERISKIIKGK